MRWSWRPSWSSDVDFVVSEGCFELDTCDALLAYRRADKAAYVVEYTNVRRKMDAYCAEAAELDLQLIFKTQVAQRQDPSPVPVSRAVQSGFGSLPRRPRASR